MILTLALAHFTVAYILLTVSFYTLYHFDCDWDFSLADIKRFMLYGLLWEILIPCLLLLIAREVFEIDLSKETYEKRKSKQ
jgi:hypothetical protein